jgi:hypothetical protein
VVLSDQTPDMHSSFSGWCGPLHASVPGVLHGQPRSGAPVQPVIGTQLPVLVLHMVPGIDAQSVLVQHIADATQAPLQSLWVPSQG